MNVRQPRRKPLKSVRSPLVAPESLPRRLQPTIEFPRRLAVAQSVRHAAQVESPRPVLAGLPWPGCRRFHCPELRGVAPWVDAYPLGEPERIAQEPFWRNSNQVRNIPVHILRGTSLAGR